MSIEDSAWRLLRSANKAGNTLWRELRALTAKHDKLLRRVAELECQSTSGAWDAGKQRYEPCGECAVCEARAELEKLDAPTKPPGATEPPPGEPRGFTL